MMTEKIAVVAPFPNADMSLMVPVFWGLLLQMMQEQRLSKSRNISCLWPVYTVVDSAKIQNKGNLNYEAIISARPKISFSFHTARLVQEFVAPNGSLCRATDSVLGK